MLKKKKKNAPLKCISNRKKGEMNERQRKKERKKTEKIKWKYKERENRNN